MDLSKQQALDADPRAMQQIYFTGNLDQAGNTRSKKKKKKKIKKRKKKKKNIFDFFTRNCKSIINLFCFNIMLV